MARGKIEKMVPIETLTSILEDPSSGSTATARRPPGWKVRIASSSFEAT
jgi:hypothetical protein